MWDALRVNLLLVAESDRFQRQNRLTPFIHWFDCVLKACRRACDAELAVRVYHDLAPDNWDLGYSSDEGRSVRSLCSDADRIGLSRDTPITYIDIVVANHKVAARFEP